MTPFTTKTLEEALTAKLMLNFGKTPEEATDQEMMKASALVLRDVMALREVESLVDVDCVDVTLGVGSFLVDES